MKLPKHLTYNNGMNVVALLIFFITSLEQDLGPDCPEWFCNRGIEFEEFETILTPATFTFILSKVVFMFEAVFCFVQLLPHYSQNEFVKEGVNYWFLAAAIFELFSFILFDMDSVFRALLSTVLLGCICRSILKILISQSAASYRMDHGHTPEEYWLLRFPFNLHAGWSIAVFVLSFNNFCVVAGFNFTAQAVVTVLSLVGFSAISVKMLLFNGQKPNYVLPAVFAFFTLGSVINFMGPGIEENFAPWVIFLMRTLALNLCLAMALGTGYIFYANELREDRSAAGAQNENYQGDGMDRKIELGEIRSDYHGATLTTTAIS